MKKQNFILWTGGERVLDRQCQRNLRGLPSFPDPVPLSRTARIEYHWGLTQFDIFVTACSLRTTAWGKKEITWLQCKGVQTMNVHPDKPASLIMVLIPAHFITSIRPDTSYHILNSRRSDDIGVFPPNKSKPAAALPLEEIERVLMELRTTERN